MRVGGLLLVLLSAVSAAPITQSIGPFDVRFYNNGDAYVDSAGTTHTGKKDWTAAEMADITAAVNAWTYRLSNGPGRQVNLYLMWDNLGSGVLGSSANPIRGDGTTATTWTEHAWRDGSAQGYSYADGFLAFGTGISWNIGSGAPGGGQIDFRSVVAHEIGHSAGFDTSYNSFLDRWSNLGITAYDSYLRDAAVGGNQPAPNRRGTPGNFDQRADPAYWDGPYAKAANGGDRVAIYAPKPYNAGSSLAHLDTSTYPNALMKHAIPYGQMVRQPTYLEWQMFKDMGWILAKYWTKGAGNLQWAQGGNWDFAGAPDALDNPTFTNVGLAAGDTIDLGGNQTTGMISFDTTVDFTIGGATGTLTLDAGDLRRSAGSAGFQTIARPVELGASGVWDIAGGGRLAVTGAIGGPSRGIEKRGDGTLLLGGVNTYSGLTTIKAGSLLLGADAPSGAPGALGSATSNVLLGDLGGAADAALLIDGAFTVGRNVNVRAGSSGAALLGGTHTAGTATFAGIISLSRDLTLTAADGGTVQFAGPISGPFGLTKTGPGAVTLAGSNLFSGNLVAHQGTLNLDSTIPAAATVTATDSAEVRFGLSQALAALALSDTATADILPGGDKTLFVNGLTIADDGAGHYTASLDVSDNALQVHYGTDPSPIAAIAAMVASGYHGGAWDGGGIASSAAAASGYALGYADGADGVVDGLAAGDLLIRYVLPGDLNLDGAVEGTDVDYLLGYFGTTGGAIWTTGDINYDGKVDGSDTDLFLGYFGSSGPLVLGEQFAALSRLATPVPEPATLVLLVLGALAAAAARRPRHV